MSDHYKRLRRFIPGAVFAALLVMFAATPVPVQAGSTYTVNTATDELDGNCGLTGEALFASNGDGLSLREAVCLSNRDVDKDIISLSQDVNVSIPGALEQGNETGDIDITQPIRIESSTITSTIGDRVLDFHPGSEGSELEFVTITGGNVAARGGGILHRNGGELSLTSVIVDDNFASDDGGGIAVRNSSTLDVDFSLINNN